MYIPDEKAVASPGYRLVFEWLGMTNTKVQLNSNFPK